LRGEQEVDIGLAADIGSLQRFPKKVGNDSIVRELAFTARFFDAKEAKGIGFLSRVVQGGRDGVVGESTPSAAHPKLQT
jgi:delta(3,5)-delta(2,4)-dienoyl-CoA isomerase